MALKPINVTKTAFLLLRVFDQLHGEVTFSEKLTVAKVVKK
jgi:hypothetical protein